MSVKNETGDWSDAIQPDGLRSDQISGDDNRDATAPHPVAFASKGDSVFFVKWTAAGAALRGGGIALHTVDQLQCALAAKDAAHDKALAAARAVIRSQELRLTALTAEREKWREAIKTIQSERDANAVLTAENANLQAEIDSSASCDDWIQLTAERDALVIKAEALHKNENLRIADAFGRMWNLSDEHLGLAMKRHPALTERLTQIARADKVFDGASKADA